MCLFSYPNRNTDSKAYRYGITKYECGSCPECLQKKSRVWALRCSMQAKVSTGMMLTLTYDKYVYNSHGDIIGEQLPASDIKVSKKDVQSFIKRLRHYFPDNDIKYLATAEYGKRTHRPHYHILVFGLVFDDLRTYKKSKRGNQIYRSPTLEKIWHGGKEKKGGICTVDSINLSAKTARYCTKYCAKDYGVDDTFMLFSHGIGDSLLLEKFNGMSYWIDGREYPIPSRIWKKYIEDKYNIHGYSKYLNFPKQETLVERVRSYSKQVNYNTKDVDYFIRKYNLSSCIKRYFRQKCRREIYSSFRDNDTLYKKYISYWKQKNYVYEKYRLSPVERILSLPDNKYRSYKNKALVTYNRKNAGLSYIPPRSNSKAMQRRIWKSIGLTSKSGAVFGEFGICRYKPRHYTTNDSKLKVINGKIVFLRPLSLQEEKKLAKSCPF